LNQVVEMIFIRIFLLSLCLVLAAPVWSSDWTIVSVGNKPEVVVYYDSQSISRAGGVRKVWLIYDYKNRETDGVMSARHRVEFDCAGGRSRVLSYADFDDHMATGTIKASYDFPLGWIDIPPDSHHEVISKRLCK